MALVRKTQTLRAEIASSIGGIISEDARSIYRRFNVNKHLGTIAHHYYHSGAMFDPAIFKHVENARQADKNQLFGSFKHKPENTKTGFQGLRRTTADTYAEIDEKLSPGLEFKRHPTMAKNHGILGGIHYGAVSFGMAVDYQRVTPALVFASRPFNYGDMPPPEVKPYWDNLFWSVRGSSSTNYGVCTRSFHELPDYLEKYSDTEEVRLAFEELKEAQEAFEASAKRMEKVREYVLKTLWEGSASLNGMHKVFPGILAYVSDDTLKRFNKNNGPTKTVNPALAPSADILAATAKAKLK